MFNLDSQTCYTQKRLGIVLLGFIPVIKGQVKLEVYYTVIKLMLVYKYFKPLIYIFLTDGILSTRNDFKDWYLYYLYRRKDKSILPYYLINNGRL